MKKEVTVLYRVHSKGTHMYCEMLTKLGCESN